MPAAGIFSFFQSVSNRPFPYSGYKLGLCSEEVNIYIYCFEIINTFSGKENIPHSSKTDDHYKHTPAFVHPVRPEDDLLQKWRLRRKMELAKEMGPVKMGQFDFLAKTEQQVQTNGFIA